MGIQFVDGKILFVDGKIAMDPACCCGAGCGCCGCDELRYDAIFSGDMGDDFSGTYTSVSKESYGEEGCKFNFGPDSPIRDIIFDCPSGTVYIHAQTVTTDHSAYYNYGDADVYASGCPIILHDPWMLEWATWSPEYPPPQFWADYLKIYCADDGEVAAPGWTQE